MLKISKHGEITGGITMNKKLSRTDEAYIEFLRVSSNVLELGLYVLLYKKFDNLEKTVDVRYQPKGKRTYLDIIKATGYTNEKRPLMIYIHGGGWVSGLRQVRRFYCEDWAENGFVCANIDYDYANDAKHPEHIRQIFKGIEYVIDNADRYGIDTTRIAVAGESAGGYFAALVSAITSHPELYDILGIEFKYKDSFKVDASVLLSGIYDPDRALSTSFPNAKSFAKAFCGMSPAELKTEEGQKLKSFLAPSYYADEKFPPSFIIGSKLDPLVVESHGLHEDLDKIGVKNELYICDGINGVHAGSLACHVGSGKDAVLKARRFVLDIFRSKEKPELAAVGRD